MYLIEIYCINAKTFWLKNIKVLSNSITLSNRNKNKYINDIIFSYHLQLWIKMLSKWPAWLRLIRWSQNVQTSKNTHIKPEFLYWKKDKLNPWNNNFLDSWLLSTFLLLPQQHFSRLKIKLCFLCELTKKIYIFTTYCLMLNEPHNLFHLHVILLYYVCFYYGTNFDHLIQ